MKDRFKITFCLQIWIGELKNSILGSFNQVPENYFYLTRGNVTV